MLAIAEELTVEFVPPREVSGLVLRRWRDNSDFVEMARVLHAAAREADGMEESATPDGVRDWLESMPGMDLSRGGFILEKDGEVIGFKTLRQTVEKASPRVFSHNGFLVPEWQGRGIGQAMLNHTEATLREWAKEHSDDHPPVFGAFGADLQVGLRTLLTNNGYTPVRYFHLMIRPNLENLPEAKLPVGFELRPATSEHYPKVWEAMLDAFSEHWGEAESDEYQYDKWVESGFFQPHLWHVAWDGDRVAGFVLNELDKDDNEKYHRQRMFTADVAVRKAYRGRGLATALMLLGLHRAREMGMTEAALDVDSENATGAFGLYQRLGYAPSRTFIAHRKQMNLD